MHTHYIFDTKSIISRSLTLYLCYAYDSTPPPAAAVSVWLWHILSHRDLTRRICILYTCLLLCCCAFRTYTGIINIRFSFPSTIYIQSTYIYGYLLYDINIVFFFYISHTIYVRKKCIIRRRKAIKI